MTSETSMPIAVAPSPLEPIDFMRRFTPAEWIAIDAARGTDAAVRYFLALFDKAKTVSLEHSDTNQAVNHFVSVGLLTPERAAEVLAPVT